MKLNNLKIIEKKNQKESDYIYEPNSFENLNLISFEYVIS